MPKKSDQEKRPKTTTYQQASDAWQVWEDFLKIDNIDEIVSFPQARYLFLFAWMEGARIEREGK